MDAANQFPTLVELLRHRATNEAEQRGYLFLADGEAETDSFTYGELDRRARSIGSRLQSAGMSGERVLLLYPPGLEFIAAFFGCLYAGAVAVPAYPPRHNRNLQRVRAILSDARPKAALTTALIASRLDPILEEICGPRKLQCVPTDGEMPGEGDWYEPSLSGDSLAFLQYTSGSTGTPKGVMLSHRNLLHNAAVVRRAVDHTDRDSYVSWLPTFHDMGMMAGVLQPLFSGIPVVLFSPLSFLQRPLLWLKIISKYRATTSGGPNFAYDLCVAKASTEDLEPLDLSSWSVAFNGAEPVRSRTIAEFSRVFEPYGFHSRAFYPCYGLAEATLMVTGSEKASAPVVKNFEITALERHRVIETDAERDDARSLVGCGHSLPGQKVIIVNPDTLSECKADEVGEVWVSGESVAAGYWQRPEETTDLFEAHVSGTEEGPFLRTDDLGFLRDGELFITGRLKDLIIIRGSNHYPQDIELTAEKSHPLLRAHCSAAFSAEIDDEERLVVAIEIGSRRSMNISVPELEAVCDAVRSAVAGEHEVQVYGLLLLKPGTIPKTSSGKVQRAACCAGYLNGTLDEVFRNVAETTSSAAELTAETLSREQLLAAAQQERRALLETWLRQQVAHCVRISPHFDTSRPLVTLGLDSLSSTELKCRIESDLGVAIPVDVLLAGGSVKQLVAEILNELNEASTAGVPDVLAPTLGTGDYHPASYIQQSLYFLHDLAPESAAYNIAFAARLSSDVDVGALRRAFQALSDRHPSLRTTYDTRDGQIVQRITPHLQVDFNHVDASGLSWPAVQARINDEANLPFNLRYGPVFKVSLFSRSAREHALLLTVHHLAIDGWSLWLLLEELRALYAAKHSGAPANLPDIAYQYEDYVRWQSELLGSPKGEQQRDYWLREFERGLPILNLPANGHPAAMQTFKGATHQFTLNEQLTEALSSFAMSQAVTLYVVLLAAFQFLLHLYTGQDDIVVGSPASGRSRPEFRTVVGCFMNPVGLRAEFSAATTFESLLTQVREKVWRALENQDYPSHLVATGVEPQRSKEHLHLFQAMFVFQKSHLPRQKLTAAGMKKRLDLGELVFELMPVEKRFARCELELEVVAGDCDIDCWFQYNADQFDASIVSNMAANLEALLKVVIGSPATPLSNFSVPAQTELRYVLDNLSNSAPKDFPKLSVVDLFQRRLEKTPDKVAAVHQSGTITFRELDERGTMLASLIRELQS